MKTQKNQQEKPNKNPLIQILVLICMMFFPHFFNLEQFAK